MTRRLTLVSRRLSGRRGGRGRRSLRVRGQRRAHPFHRLCSSGALSCQRRPSALTSLTQVGRDPEQCLRYCFDRDVQPLWPAPQPTPSEGGIPPCSRCGSPRCPFAVSSSAGQRSDAWMRRRFEFQVMPQLLNFLGLAEDDAAALDFGTIAVYSCSASCALEPNKLGCAYAEEYAFVQPAAEGHHPGLRTALQETEDE